MARSAPEEPPIPRARLSHLRERIAAIRRVSLETADVEGLKEQLTGILRGWHTRAFWLERGQLLYRGVRWANRPNNTSQLGYPPGSVVSGFGRANRPGQPMFYCGIGREAPFFELRCQMGDHIALSCWRIKDPIWVNNVGYTDTLLRRSSRTELPAWVTHGRTDNSPADRIIHRFLSNEFSRAVGEHESHLYKMSVAIAEKLFGDLAGPAIPGFPALSRFGGVMYPALAMRGNSDNLVLLPEFVDSHLELKDVEFIRVDRHRAELEYDITYLDFANTFASDGTIMWKGRLPQWTLPPGGEMTFQVESGRWVARDKAGNLVEPS